MSKRKVKLIEEEYTRAASILNDAQIKLKELEDLAENARQEELTLVNSTKESILQLCDKHDIFCGVILTTDDLLTIVKLAIDSKENIKIPFALYFNN